MFIIPLENTTTKSKKLMLDLFGLLCVIEIQHFVPSRSGL